MRRAPWFRDRQSWRLIGYRFLPVLGGLNLAWETAHVPLYTIWNEASPAYIAFSVAHCTLGDVLIGGLALLLALIVGREGAPDEWRWLRTGVLSAAFGVGYTVFSEWMNITILRIWVYAESMPTVDLGGFEIGLTPIAQWLVLPPLTLFLARRKR